MESKMFLKILFFVPYLRKGKILQLKGVQKKKYALFSKTYVLRVIVISIPIST